MGMAFTVYTYWWSCPKPHKDQREHLDEDRESHAYIEGSYTAQTKEPWDKKGLGRSFDLGEVEETRE